MNGSDSSTPRSTRIFCRIPSQYNLFFKTENGFTLGYNSFSNALLEISPEEENIVKDILSQPEVYDYTSEVVATLSRNGFLIPCDADEYKLLQEELRFREKPGPALRLTVAPTMDCNFRCSYCFEKHDSVKMSPGVQEGLLDFIANRLTGKKDMHITWFGGEPLLAMDIIESLTPKIQNLCNTSGVIFNDSSIITNGYLLTKQVVKKLQQFQINRAQVTLDGPMNIHDRRRPHLNGSSFDTIINNLKEVSQLIRVDLRINIDHTNHQQIPELLDFLDECGLLKNLAWYLAPVKHINEQTISTCDEFLTPKEFARAETKLMQQSVLKNYIQPRYPVRHGGPNCGVATRDGYVINPRGDIFKCWNEVNEPSEKAIGSVLIPPWDDLKNPYEECSPFTDLQCKQCKILPLCKGGCPYFRRFKMPRDCSERRYNLAEQLYLFHSQRCSINNSVKV